MAHNTQDQPLDLRITKSPKSTEIPLDLSTKNPRKRIASTQPKTKDAKRKVFINSSRPHQGPVSERLLQNRQSSEKRKRPSSPLPSSSNNTSPPNSNRVVAKPYTIVQDKKVKKWKTGVEERQYTVKFHSDKSGQKLTEVRDNLVTMFDDVIQIAAANYGPQDKCRLNIGHSDLSSDIVVHLQNLQNLDGEAVMNRFERVLNSHEQMRADDSFEISVGLMRTNKGGGKPKNTAGKKSKPGGRALHLLPHLTMKNVHNAILNKKSIVNLLPDPGRDQICAAKSIYVCKAKLDGMKPDNFHNLIRKDRQFRMGETCLKYLSLQLQQKTGLPTDRPLTVPELSLFEHHVNAKICVIQFLEGVLDPVVTPCSTDVYEKEIFLYLFDDHFYPVLNVDAMFPKHKLCRKCYQTYPTKGAAHPCLPQKCLVCDRNYCQLGVAIKCDDCNMTCRNEACFQAHRTVSSKRMKKSRCESYKKCNSCGKMINTRKISLSEHVCDTYECKMCEKWVDSSHLCYLRRKSMKSTSGKFIFFDFESIQSETFECVDGYRPGPTVATGCGKMINEGQHCNQATTCLKCKLCRNCKKSNCGRFVHQPNFVVAESSCDICKDEILTDASICKNCGDLCENCIKKKTPSDEIRCKSPISCGLRRKIFSGLNTTHEFCSWLIAPTHRNYICSAHNGKFYDFSFILNFLITEAHILPECVFAGAKLMGMEIKNGLDIKFVDSINFMSMALSKLPRAFGLQPEQLGLSGGDVAELAKLPFPHLFNTRENIDYVGPFPPIEAYGIEAMSEKDAQKLREWYSQQEGKVFDMQEQLKVYCTLDTSILRLACNKFRDLVKSVTTREWEDGQVTFVDCFSHLTIASMVMQIFRLNHIEEYYDVTLSDGTQANATKKGGDWSIDGHPLASGDIVEKSFVSSNLAQIPAQGYVRSSNHSKKSIGWLEYRSKVLGRQLLHARNYGEEKIKCGEAHYLVDGFDPLERTCYLFHGCFYHGHSCQARKVKDQRTGFNMKDLNERTKKIETAIKQAGYKLITIYECEWDQTVRENREIQNFLAELDIPERLRIREAFFGGRTSGFKLHYACNPNEEIHYVDVCSLYPYINKTAKMPVGHPTIITKDFDFSLKSYFGIAHVKILPPKHEYIPILPVRLHGKLTFPLCRTCAEKEQHERCEHSSEQRALTGVWCTPELMAAVEQGYSILKVYEVYHYDKFSQYSADTGQGGLFAQQVDLFLKIKAEASGYPEHVITESDKDQFIKEFQSKCGVLLEKAKIVPNPALRSISKICLNSFWGKLGQKLNKTKCKYIRQISELTKMLNNSMYHVINFHIINEEVIVIEYDDAEGFERESFITNEVLAAFTTCWARLELYKYMKVVGRNILYCDTDSLIFRTKKVIGADGQIRYENFPPVGSSLGELTNELKPNSFIKEFVCSAPKSYSYVTNTGEETTKFKGVTLNGLNSGRVNFAAVKELVFGNIKEINLQPQVQFQRDKFQGVITNAPLVKKLVSTYNKRRILSDLDTVPFGYIEPNM